MRVQRITDAPPPLAEDIAARTKHYLISMAVRTVFFVLAIVIGGWLRWVFIAAAVILPYIAVTIANSAADRVGDNLPAVLPDQPAELEAGPPRELGEKPDGPS